MDISKAIYYRLGLGRAEFTPWVRPSRLNPSQLFSGQLEKPLQFEMWRGGKFKDMMLQGIRAICLLCVFIYFLLGNVQICS